MKRLTDSTWLAREVDLLWIAVLAFFAGAVLMALVMKGEMEKFENELIYRMEAERFERLIDTDPK